VRIICVSPGADWATVDVFNGIVGGLRRLGHEVVEYPMDQRFVRAGSWLDYLYGCQPEGTTLPPPTYADKVYEAGKALVIDALRLQPDWLLFVTGMIWHPDHLVHLRRAGMRLALLGTEDPYDQEHVARLLPLVDVAWTNERSSVPYLRRFNPNVSYLPHAFDPEKHTPIKETTPDSATDKGKNPEPDVPAHDVLFIGTAFQERVELFSGVDWDGLGCELALYGNWDTLPKGHRLERYVRGDVIPNAQAVALYQRAKINVNAYRTSKGFGEDAPRIAHAESLNPRALELAACGAFYVSDWRPEVAEVFGGAVPTYATPTELEALIAYYLERPDLRADIAAVLPQLVRGRTFDAAAAQVVGDLEAAFRESPAERDRIERLWFSNPARLQEAVG
jgi:glycosyltransferase involved in cell wall biosynthesis